MAAVIDAADREGIGWDDVAELDETDVYGRLFPGRGEHESVHAQPDWGWVHKELAKVGVTLKLLHGEYVDACRGRGETAMGYDRFCKSYQRHVLVIGAASRVGHKAGQTVEVDWSGKTMQLTDPVTGQMSRVYLFVATLPFSRYSFVEPTLDMRQDTWLRANAAMFGWFGGSVPRIVPDNLKTGVIKHPAEGEVVLNDAYRELAAHYSAAVLPGEAREAEGQGERREHRRERRNLGDRDAPRPAVRVTAGAAGRGLRSRHRVQREVVPEARGVEAFRVRGGGEAVAAAAPGRWVRDLPWFYGRRVQKNGHVVFERNFYSVPYTNIGRTVDLRITDTTLEVFAGDQRLTSHLLAPAGMVNEYRTHDSDLPDGPRYQQMDPERAREWAARIGENTTTIVNRIFESVPVDEQGLGAALAVLRMTRRYSAARVEAAAAIALASRVRSPRYAHLRPILESNQDQTGRRQPRFEPSAWEEPAGYVRGADYYAGDAR